MESVEEKKKSLTHWILLLLNCAALLIGATAGPLILRFYFLHGGSRKWLSAWLQTAGCPLLVIPLCFSYKYNPHKDNHITSDLFMASCVLGVLTGLDDYMYASGMSYLPVSTSSLLIASQLGFTALFAYLIVGQKLTPYSLNAVMLLTMGSVLLAFHTSGDRPKGVSNGEYVLGFLLTIGAAALYGLILPLIELAYKKSKNRRITYTLVMEMQLVMSCTATLLCTIGMIVNKDFQAIGREAEGSDVGKVGYYMGLVGNAICWQLFFIGVFGVICLVNSLFSGVLIAVAIPVTEVLAVIVYHEKFTGEKGMALVMAMWGFASYLYGEHRGSKEAKRRNNQEEDHTANENLNAQEMGAVALAVEQPKSNQCLS